MASAPQSAASPSSMSGRSSAASRKYVEAIVERVGGALRRAALTTGALRLAIVLAGAALVVVVLDHALPGGAPRGLMILSGWLWSAALVFGIASAAWRVARLRPTAAFAARLMEKLTAVRHNRLVNYVYLAAGGHPALEAAEREIGGALRGEPLRGAARLAGEPRLLAPLLGVATGWLLFAAITPKPIAPSLARMFGSDQAAPTATQLRLIAPAPEAVVYQGDALTVEVERTGRPVREVIFTRTSQGGAAALDNGEAEVILAHPMLRGGLRDDGRERWQLELAPHETSAAFEYRITAGDAELRGAVHPLPLPTIDQCILRIQPPAHVGEPAYTIREGDLSAWAESTAEIELLANTAIQDAALVIEHASRAVTRLRPDPAAPRIARLSTRLRESGTFWIEFRDVNGRAGRTTPRRLILRPDRPPEVTIVRPSAEETPTGELDLTQTAAIHVDARDDVRLSALTLVLDRRGVSERIALRSAAQLAAQREVTLSLASDFFPVREGEAVRAWFEAADNHADFNGAPAPQTARSRTVTLVRSRPPPPPEDPRRGMEGEETDVSPDRNDPDGDESEMVESTRAAAADGDGDGVPGGPTVRAPDDGERGDENVLAGESPLRDAPEAGRSRGNDELGDALREFIEQHGDTVRRMRDAQPEIDPSGGAPDDEAADENRSEPTAGQPEREDASGDDASQPDRPTGDDAETAQDAEGPKQPENPGAESGPESPQTEEPREREPQEEPTSRPQAADDEDQSASEPADESTPNEPDVPEADAPEPDPGESVDDSIAADDPGDSQVQGGGAADEAAQPGESEGMNGSNASGDADDSPEAEEPREQPATDPGDAPPPQDGSAPPGQSGGPTPGGAMDAPAGAASSDDPGEMGDAEDGSPEAPGEPSDAPGEAPARDVADPDAGVPPGMAEQLADVNDLLNQSPDELEQTLEELGLGDDERRAFVESIERLRLLAHEAGVVGELLRFAPGEAPAGEILTGRGALRLEADDPARAPEPAAIRAPREQRIAAELQALLDAYYAALAADADGSE